MYEEIRNLAVKAVKLQNKLNMEATLIRIAELCDAAYSAASQNTCDDGQVATDRLRELVSRYGRPPAEFLDALTYNAAKNWPVEELIAVGDVLVAADGQEFKVGAVVAEHMGLDQAIASIKNMTRPQSEAISHPQLAEGTIHPCDAMTFEQAMDALKAGQSVMCNGVAK